MAVAMAAARELGLQDLQLAGLAKERETAAGDKLVDRVYLPGQLNPVALREHNSALFLLAQLRDEAHRFANRGRRGVGKKRRMSSRLDTVPGIGPKTRTALLKEFGSIEKIRAASDELLLQVAGVHRGHVKALRSALAEPTEIQRLALGGNDVDTIAN